MKVEFEARWIKIKEGEIMSAEDRKIRRLLGNDDEENDAEVTIEYEYSPLVIDLFDIKTFNKLDKDHVTLRLDSGDAFSVKCKYRLFKFVYEQSTRQIIASMDDFKINEELMQKAEIVNEVLNKVKVDTE